jgi:hypothetical protein
LGVTCFNIAGSQIVYHWRISTVDSGWQLGKALVWRLLPRQQCGTAQFYDSFLQRFCLRLCGKWCLSDYPHITNYVALQPEGSSTPSQEPATCPYFNLTESTHPASLPKINFDTIIPSTSWSSESYIFFGLCWKSLVHPVQQKSSSPNILSPKAEVTSRWRRRTAGDIILVVRNTLVFFSMWLFCKFHSLHVLVPDICYAKTPISLPNLVKNVN